MLENSYTATCGVSAMISLVSIGTARERPRCGWMSTRSTSTTPDHLRGAKTTESMLVWSHVHPHTPHVHLLFCGSVGNPCRGQESGEGGGFSMKYHLLMA